MGDGKQLSGADFQKFVPHACLSQPRGLFLLEVIYYTLHCRLWLGKPAWMKAYNDMEQGGALPRGFGPNGDMPIVSRTGVGAACRGLIPMLTHRGHI